MPGPARRLVRGGPATYRELVRPQNVGPQGPDEPDQTGSRRRALAVKSQEFVHPGHLCEGGCRQTTTNAKEAPRMNVHQNARTTLWSRVEIVRRVTQLGQSVSKVAATFQVSAKTARRWVERAATGADLRDHSCRPHRSPAATPPELLAYIERLRRQRWTSAEIAAKLRLGRS